MALPEVGVQVVAKGAETAQKQLSAFNRSLSTTQSAVQKAASKSGQLDSAAGGTAKSIGGLGGAFTALGGSVGIAITAMNQGLEILGKIVSTARQVIDTFVKLGRQAIQIESIGKAFGNIFASVDSGNAVLNKLRQQVHGTISDVELMRLAVAGLQNTDAEFKKIVGTQFGTIIDSTRRIAEATGQSADQIQEKFIRGLRLSRKLLVDDVGAIFELKDAYAAYAKELGKSADALTEQEKRAAFAKEAIRQLANAADEIGTRNVISDSLNQSVAAMQNMKDILVTALKPLFADVFGVAAEALTAFQSATRSLAPLLHEIAGVVGGVVRASFDALKDALKPLEPIWNNMMVVLPYIAALVRLLGQAFAKLAGFIVKGFVKPFTAIFGQVGKLTDQGFQQLAFRFARGAGHIVGAFAKGLADGAKYVLQAVTFIAQIVADFLEGFSPPKRGPLSDIDKGATRVAEAWADGFAMMDLEPVDNVLSRVNARLGDIGTFTREQVATRLEALDLAIRPFVEQLDIVKADFEAIAGFADPALKAIDRQRSRLLQLAGKGSLIDIGQLRALDRQADVLSEIKNTSQDAVDNAEIQLALASAQQAQERALLNIQKRRLGEAEKIAAQTGGGGTDRPTTGGAGESPTDEAGVEIPMGGIPPDLIDTSAVDAALATIEAGFNKGLAESGALQAIAGATAQLGALRQQTARIKRADPVDKLTKKFEGLKEKLSKPFTDAQIAIDAVLTTLGLSFDNMGLKLDTLVTKFTDIGNNIVSNFIPKLTSLSNQFGLTLPISFGIFNSSLTTNIISKITELLAWLEGYAFPDLTTLSNWFSIDLPFAFDDFLASLIVNVSEPLLDLEKTISDKVEQAFRRLADFMSTTFRTVITSVLNTVILPLSNAFTSLANTLSGVKSTVDSVASALANIPDAIPDWLIPGSPTPFEIGLRGITNAMQELRQSGLKPLTFEFAKLPTPEMIMPTTATQYGYGGGGMGNTSIDNSRNANLGGVTIQVNNPSEALWVKRQLLAQYGV